MSSNPVESNFVTRFVLGLAVIVAMFVGAGVLGTLFGRTEIPYAGGVGVFVGATVVFVGFAIWYTGYSE